jgi:tripartite motif-containing protein 71
MRAKAVLAVVVVALVTLLVVVSPVVLAQGPEPGPGSALRDAVPAGEATTEGVSPAVALGQPGLSFRYVQTFGTAETAYLEDNSHINAPEGVGADGANVWIAESRGLRAMKFSNSGFFSTQLGKAGYFNGMGQDVDLLSDVAVDGSGNIWVVDGAVHHILKFSSTGVYVSKLGQSWSSGSDNSRFNGPRSIAFDSVGNVYVSDANNHRIQVFTSGGAYLSTIGTGSSGSGTNQLSQPRHIAIDSGNLLYVADRDNQRVQVFNVASPASPAYVTTIGVSGVSGSDNGHFAWPMGVHVDASRIYVADFNNHRVQVFDRFTRAYQSTIGAGSAGSSNNHFNGPADVAVDSAGNIYVADRNNHRVQQFNSSLVFVRTYGTTGVPYLTDSSYYNKPAGLAVAADGSLYAVEERGYRLVKLNAAGVPQWTVGEAGVSGTDNNHFGAPSDVALDSAGRVYVADASNNRIQIFNPDGSYYGTFGGLSGAGNYNFNYPRGLFIAPTIPCTWPISTITGCRFTTAAASMWPC